MKTEAGTLFTMKSAERIAGVVRIVESQRPDPKQPRGNQASTPMFVWAKVVSSAVLSTNRWTYTLRQQDMSDTGWSDTTDYYTYTPCYNGCEANNDGTGVQGNGIDIDGADFPAGMAIVPIAVGCVVQLWPGQLTAAGVRTWRFFAVNSVDGTCAA